MVAYADTTRMLLTYECISTLRCECKELVWLHFLVLFKPDSIVACLYAYMLSHCTRLLVCQTTFPNIEPGGILRTDPLWGGGTLTRRSDCMRLVCVIVYIAIDYHVMITCNHVRMYNNYKWLVQFSPLPPVHTPFPVRGGEAHTQYV